MTHLLRQHSATLYTLSKCPPGTRKKILKAAPNGLIKVISQCAKNTIKGNIPLTRVHISKLKPHRLILRKLANKSLSLKKKRALLVQRGAGFLPFLLGPILTGLAKPLLSGLANTFFPQN